MLSPRQLANITRAAGSTSNLSATSRMEAARRARQAYTKQSRQLMGQVSGDTEILRKLLDGNIAGAIGDATGLGDSVSDGLIRYAKSGFASGFVSVLLNKLGPVGSAIRMLISGQAKGTGINEKVIRDAIKLLRSIGLEVRLPDESDVRGLVPAPQLDPLTGRTRIGGGNRVAPPAPENIPAPPQLPVGKLVGDTYVPMELVQGSSNVYAIGYNPETQTLRVTYLARAVNLHAITGRGHKGKNRVRGKLGRTVSQHRSGSGPVYDYFNVPPRVWSKLNGAASKGKAIWDELRIRGTVYGHKFDYRLSAAGVADVIVPLGNKGKAFKTVGRVTYVPRKATGPGSFQARTMRQGSSTFRSLLRSQRGNP